VAARKSCAALRQGNYWDYLILGRVLRPHQGDTVSPRRGLKNTGDIWAFGRMPRLTASIKPLMQLLIFFQHLMIRKNIPIYSL